MDLSTVETGIIEPCAKSLGFPSQKSRFFSCSEGGKGLCFFYSHSREGNFGPHSTQFNYSSFYGTQAR